MFYMSNTIYFKCHIALLVFVNILGRRCYERHWILVVASVMTIIGNTWLIVRRIIIWSPPYTFNIWTICYIIMVINIGGLSILRHSD